MRRGSKKPPVIIMDVYDHSYIHFTKLPKSISQDN